MIPGGMDPKKMQSMMKQMGIKSEEIPATKVVIETESGNYVIDDPQVVEITVQGQKSYQVSGNPKFEETVREEDIKMVMEQADCSKEEAMEALQATKGDIAEAIVYITDKKAKE